MGTEDKHTREEKLEYDFEHAAFKISEAYSTPVKNQNVVCFCKYSSQQLHEVIFLSLLTKTERELTSVLAQVHALPTEQQQMLQLQFKPKA